MAPLTTASHVRTLKRALGLYGDVDEELRSYILSHTDADMLRLHNVGPTVLRGLRTWAGSGWGAWPGYG